MYWIEILENLGFVCISVEDCIYVWQGFEFDFSSRRNIDSIVACIWDTAQHYGEKKREKEIIKNILKG